MKKKNNYLAILIILLISLLMSGCAIPLFSGNEPVYITSNPNKTALVGKVYSYQVAIEDDAKTQVTFSLAIAPQGMTIDRATGLVNWSPTAEQIGEHEVGVNVSDGWFKDNQKYTLTVKEVELSKITVQPTTMEFNSAGEKTIQSITAYYTDGSTKNVSKTQCTFTSSSNTAATVSTEGVVTYLGSGTATITVSYTEEGITKTATISVKKEPTSG